MLSSSVRDCCAVGGSPSRMRLGPRASGNTSDCRIPLIGMRWLRLKPLAKSLTFHDPCQVSRRGGASEAPRKVLAALGVELREMTDHADAAYCCGGGGGVVAIKHADELRRGAFRIKMEEVDATGAELLATSCANCRLSFDDGAAFHKWGKSMQSLTELVADRLEG